MKNLLNFFLEAEKLKTMPRTGWVLMGVKDPETIAEHTFRIVIAVWLLAEKKNLNIKRIIKSALSHDLCEVYAGDMTPFFYYLHLPKDKTERKKRLMKWVRLSKKEKRKKGKKKLEIERKSLLKLIKFLKPDLKKEVFSSWFDFEKRTSKEGRFVKQVDRIETLIQSIEYFGPKKDVGGTSWWEGTEEIVDDPLLLKFLKVIQKKFYGRVVGSYRKQKELENILDFILEIGKLKGMPRTLWVSLGVENPETVASHIFTVSLMAWIFGQKKKKLSMEKLLKMALCHDIPAVYTGDLITPYSKILAKDEKERRKIFQKWPRLLRKEKQRKFLKDYKKEKIALKKLTLRLKAPLRKEIIQLFDEYKTASTPEARFLNQLNVLAVLLRALLYQKEDKSLLIDWLWEWAFEKCEDPVIFEFIEELKKKFYKKNLIHKFILNFPRFK
ncbi:HD domain-containing protein [Patescibacteria group bacterium]|nr:HD domain-containing protein [Patescibacteria group bacterium]